MTNAELIDWRLSLCETGFLCDLLAEAMEQGWHERALQIHAELRTRISEAVYPEHHVTY